MNAPVCPANPAYTRSFVVAKFGSQAADVLDGASSALAVRERMMQALRREVRLREAERYGWSTLAGILLGLPLSLVTTMPVSDLVFRVRGGPADPLPIPLCLDFDTVEVKIEGADVSAVDPTDRAGFELFSLSGQVAAGKAAVNVGGRALGANSVADALIGRLRKAADHG